MDVTWSKWVKVVRRYKFPVVSPGDFMYRFFFQNFKYVIPLYSGLVVSAEGPIIMLSIVT